MTGERLPTRAEEGGSSHRQERRAGRVSLGDDEVTVLRGVSHALASTPSYDDLGSALTTWVEAALGTPAAETRILARDPGGRTRAIRSESRSVLGQQRLRQRIRRRALRSKRPHSASLQAGLGFAVFPMVSRGEMFGALEVAAPELALVERWGTLEIVASQGAIALRHISQAAELQGTARRMAALASLGRDLLAASSPEAAVHEALRFLHAEFGAPVVGWLAPESSHRLTFVDALGVDAGRRRRLKRWSPSVTGSGSERARLAERFERLVAAGGVETLGLDEGLVLLGSSTAEARQTLVIIGPLLDNAITLLSDVATARLRNERLDAGIAWTAHELRSPLVGLRALLDLEAMSPQAAEDLSDLRATARRDLAALLQQVEDLLQWALGGDRLPTQAADLVQLIREAVTASLPEESTGRVVLDGPPALQVAAEPAELRRAITNVIQNALTHSPRDVPVRVSMRSSGGIVTIKVADRGHGVSSTEARALFDPLARGEETQGPRSAHGLGLFIARRIVEAQGGSIRVDPRAPGTTFIIELPARSPDPSAA